MRRYPSSWTNTLARLGFQRRRRPRRRRDPLGRTARIEQLEPRQMLSGNVNTLLDDTIAGNGLTSLREALVGGGSVTFDSSLNGGTIALTNQLTISNTVTITGPGAGQLTIDAQRLGRVFQVTGGGNATISGLTVTGGGNVTLGGGIYSQGNLTLQSVVIDHNTCSINGGGIFSSGGSLQLIDSTVSYNTAIWGGGANVGSSDTTTGVLIQGSTFHHNTADYVSGWQGSGSGGGLFIAGTATNVPLSIVNSTFSSNYARQAAGMYVNGANTRLSITNATITANEATIDSGLVGGIITSGALVTLNNTILAANISDNGSLLDAYAINGGAITGSYNLLGQPHQTVTLAGGTNDLIGTQNDPLEPLLAPLGGYGRPTMTHLPLPGSPAIDKGDNAFNEGSLDQRGAGRQIDDTTAASANGSLSDIGAVEADNRYAVGDFNGDGRQDELRYSPLLKTLIVAESAPTAAGWEVSLWGALPPLATGSWDGFTVGDFNGDGRDDVLVKKSTDNGWSIAVSDGSAFFVHDLGISGAWAQQFVGDFDNDGADELLARTGVGATWQVIQYDDVRGGQLVSAGSSMNDAAFAVIYVGDANRDGRDDLISRANTSQPWFVSLSNVTPQGTGSMAGNISWGNWFNAGYDPGTNTLDVDKPYDDVLNAFAWVYNNVELELYPGLMKGPEATEQTKAGNDWDQAALLEEKLSALGVDAKIAYGTVTVAASEAEQWLGVTSLAAAAIVISSLMDGNVSYDLSAATVTFKHAWVQAQLPGSGGLSAVYVDPSWKFKDRQAGLPISSTSNLSGANHNLGVFDEFEYLALDPNADQRLPVEFFADQLSEYLAVTQPGMSVADVAYDGPILTQDFAKLPVGLASGVTLASSVTTYDSLGEIVGNSTARQQLLHWATITVLKNGTQQLWSHPIYVPQDSLKSIQITFAPNVGSINNVSAIAGENSSQFWSRLVIDDAVVAKSTVASAQLSSSDSFTIKIEHFAPDLLVDSAIPTRWDRAGASAVSFERKAGQIIAVGLDANQYSRETLAAMQSALLTSIAGHSTEASLLPDVDDLASYAGAKYWYDFNRYGKAISHLTHAIGGRQWVGSGIVAADPLLLLDPQGADVLIDFLPFGMAPRNFGVDLPNINYGVYSVDTGLLNREGWQLVGYNSSALEHNIVQEVISAGSVSTMKGLQRTFRNNLGLNAQNNPLPGSDRVLVLKSTMVNGVRRVDHLFNWHAGAFCDHWQPRDGNQSGLSDRRLGPASLPQCVHEYRQRHLDHPERYQHG